MRKRPISHSRRQPRTTKTEFQNMTIPEKIEYRAAQKKRRARRLTPRSHKILELVKEGFIVEQLTPSHFLVNGRLDLWPIHNTWHDRVALTHGHAKNLAVFAREWRKQ